MNQAGLNGFLEKLARDFKIIAPVKENEEIYFQAVKNFKNFKLLTGLPVNSFKEFLLPFKETLFVYQNDRFEVPKKKAIPQVILGVSPIDLKAFGLFEQVFEKDPYYQALRRQTVIIGQSEAPQDWSAYRFFKDKYEEDILEHLVFDIFLERRGLKFQVFSGSELGQKLLEKAKVKDYEHIEFAGLIKEEGSDPRMLKLKEKVKKSYGNKIWEEMAKKCLACGRCTFVCPTCFCFRIDDQPTGKKGEFKRIRQWDACFFSEFSKVAGGKKFLAAISQRLYFWYYHKFVRIPDEFSIPGCTGCGRCIRACPVGIDIRKILASIEK